MEAHENGACGKLPGIGTAVTVDPVGFALIASGEAQMPVAGLEEPDVSQPEGGMGFAQLAQLPEVAQNILVFLTPGIGAAVEGIPAGRFPQWT